MLHLIDCLRFSDRRGPLAKIKDFIVTSIVLFLVGLVDKNVSFKGLRSVSCVTFFLCSDSIRTRNRSERSPFFDHLSES